MGIGDEIMVAGEIKRHSRGTGARFRVRDVRSGKFRWHDIWADNPLIAPPDEKAPNELSMGPGNRPYIKAKFLTQWFWKAYSPTPADIFLRADEEDFALASRGKVIVSPTLKPSASPNKQWPYEFWEKLVSEHPEVPWLQIGDTSDRRLPIPFLLTPSFRHAVGALKGARAAVLQEGGLHHAAAAVHINSVVLFGGFISPACTGYRTQVNLFTGGGHPLGCGSRIPCAHCHCAMRAITPEIVFNELRKLI